MPPIINEALLNDFRAARLCGFCRRPAACQPHHLYGKGMGGWRRYDIRINLLNLCVPCHRLFHDGHVDIYDLLRVVAEREGTTPAAITAEIYRLRRL